MKQYNTIYYLLYVLIVFGAFASMAQNDYGLSILGLVSIAFTLLFAVQLIQELARKDARLDVRTVLESTGLIVLSAIIAMRVYYIRFEYVEVLFAIGGAMAIVAYAWKALSAYDLLRHENSSFAILILIFFVSLVMYLVAMVATPFLPSFAELAGGSAFVLLLVFLGINFTRRQFMLGGEKIWPFKYVIQLRDRSVLLMSLFLAFTLYMGLTRIDLLPKMYSDQFPQGYFELVNRAESGLEKPVSGNYRHEEFKELYDKFVERNGTAE